MPCTCDIYACCRNILTHFFHYPTGLKDRSAWEPRDTNQYIRQWYELASMRTRVLHDADATEHGHPFSKAEVTQIFTLCVEDMKEDLRAGQEDEKPGYVRRCVLTNERKGRPQVRCKRYLGDRASSAPTVCVRAMAIAAYRSST